MYQTTNDLSRKFSLPEVPVEGQDGEMIFGKEAKMNGWVDYLKELLNIPTPTEPPDIIQQERTSTSIVNPNKRRDWKLLFILDLA